MDDFAGPTTTANLQGLTYPVPNIRDYTLDQNVSETQLPLDNGRHTLNPKTGLGSLEILPLEILHEILVQVDLRSLTDMRCVNQRALHVVDSIPQYQTIIRHGVVCLRSILAIDIGTVISCEQLCQTLTTATCEKCHDFAGYIYLLTCSRVCFLCATGTIEYLPLLSGEVRRRFALPRSIVAALPHFTSVPGIYSPNENVRPSRLELYDYEIARHAAMAYHGSEAAIQQCVDSVFTSRNEAYQSRVLERSVTGIGPTPRRPPQVKSLDKRESNPKRFMALIRAPCVNVYAKTEEWGFHCVGCQKHYNEPPLHWRRKYSAPSFEEHLRECG